MLHYDEIILNDEVISMSDKIRFAVIPAYEPGTVLLQLAQELKKEHYQLIVVDDGSGEKYAPVFDALEEGACVLRSSENHGKGHAMKKAFAHLMETQTEHCSIVVMDCDGQHRVSDAVMLSSHAEKDPGTLYLGARTQTSDCPWKSRIGNKITKMVFHAVSGSGIQDTQTGLRAFTSDLLPGMLEITGERYEYEMNMLMGFADQGIPIREIPIETIYIDNNSGSHFHAVKDSWRIYREILKFSGSSLVSFLLDYLLYTVLTLLTGGALVVSNVLARIASAAFNYTLNRNVVFRDDGAVWKSAVRYFLLAAGILVCNTILLILMTRAGLNAYAAKVLTEMLLFVISFLVQKKVVFQKQQKGMSRGGFRLERILEK